MGSDGSDGEGGGGLGASRGVGRAQDACDAQHWHVPRNKSGAADVQHVMVALVSRVHGTDACDGLRERMSLRGAPAMTSGRATRRK